MPQAKKAMGIVTTNPPPNFRRGVVVVVGEGHGTASPFWIEADRAVHTGRDGA